MTGKISWARVLAGGLVAGLAGNILEMGYGLAMRGAFEAAAKAAGKPVEMRPAAMIAHLLWSFVLGIAAVWLYAAIRPRYGPGPKTAVVAGVAVWLFAHATFALGAATLGLFPASLAAIGAAWELFETILSVLVGAAIYKEAGVS